MMKFVFEMWLVTWLIVGCSTVEKSAEESQTPLATPTPTPQAEVVLEPQGTSKMQGADHEYALYLEKILNKMSSSRDEKPLYDFVRFLHYGEAKYAKGYIDSVLERASERESPIPGLGIFEGSYVLCQHEGHRCVKTLGDLTRAYFIPLVKAGEPNALELFVIHGAATDLDGVEEDAYQEVADTPELKKQAAAIKHIKQKYKKHLSKIQ
jgi:hypothetical protein